MLYRIFYAIWGPPGSSFFFGLRAMVRLLLERKGFIMVGLFGARRRNEIAVAGVSIPISSNGTRAGKWGSFWCTNRGGGSLLSSTSETRARILRAVFVAFSYILGALT